MYLTKSCEKQHHIRNGTIKLGTLHEYRETESAQIADKHEGTLDFLLRFNGVVQVPLRWFNLINNSFIHLGPDPIIEFPGNFDAKMHNFQLVGSDANFAYLKNTYVDIKREVLNCFVFCMSRVELPDDCLGIFPDYDDYWHIGIGNTKEFAEAICRQIMIKIKDGHESSNYVVPQEIDINKIVIHVRYGNILYTPRELVFTQADSANIDSFFSSMFHMAFIKPPHPFEKEKEYRFEFTLSHENKLIQPLVKSLILDAENLHRFVL
jgi:hypothetical protein